MNVNIDLQVATEEPLVPEAEAFHRWVCVALQSQVENAELTIRIVDEEESAKLNQTFRNKPGATNVLAFPFYDSHELGLDLLGDIVICAKCVAHEAKEQNKILEAHWAHLVIHGTLHLLGYDHTHEKDAAQMESLEIKILNELGFANPYEEEIVINE